MYFSKFVEICIVTEYVIIFVKDFEIIVDGTTYDHHEIAKRLRVPNLELDYYDIDINKDHNVFMVKSNKRHIIRKIE